MMTSDQIYVLVAALIATAVTVSGCDEPTAWAGDDPESAESNADTTAEPRSDTSSPDPDTGSERARTDADGGSSDRSLVDRAMDPTVPLPDEARETFSEIDFDPIPEDITENSHYVVSNENHHRLYRPHIEGHGGILMGVGTDQNYLMAGWAKSPILLMMDFDEQVRNVHHLYGIVFDRVETPKAFIEQWDEPEHKKIAEWIEQVHSDDDERAKALKKTLDMSHHLIHARLKRTAREHRREGIPTFVSSQEQYDFIRGLWERGRVIPIRGDLTGDVAMQEIASALRELDLEVGLLYLSNAEQYFPYSPTYRRNIAVMPFAGDGKILRTRPMEALGLPEEGKYHYNIQPARHFAGWLVDNHIDNAKQMVTWYMKDPTYTKGLSFVKKAPVVSKTQPKIADVGGEYDLQIDQEKPRGGDDE